MLSAIYDYYANIQILLVIGGFCFFILKFVHDYGIRNGFVISIIIGFIFYVFFCDELDIVIYANEFFLLYITACVLILTIYYFIKFCYLIYSNLEYIYQININKIHKYFIVINLILLCSIIIIIGKNEKVQYGIGSVYSFVNLDNKAVYWYEKAAKKGNKVTQYNLGKLYEEGNGIKKDYKKAFEFYQMSAKKGYDKAQYVLGKMYEEGKGIQKDFQKAFELYILAAEQGNLDAKLIIGFDFETNYKEAFEKYKTKIKEND